MCASTSPATKKLSTCSSRSCASCASLLSRGQPGWSVLALSCSASRDNLPVLKCDDPFSLSCGNAARKLTGPLSQVFRVSCPLVGNCFPLLPLTPLLVPLLASLALGSPGAALVPLLVPWLPLLPLLRSEHPRPCSQRHEHAYLAVA